MSEALPNAMVPRLTQLASDLAVWAQQHRDAPLAEQEQAVLELVRAALPDLQARLGAGRPEPGGGTLRAGAWGPAAVAG